MEQLEADAKESLKSKQLGVEEIPLNLIHVAGRSRKEYFTDEKEWEQLKLSLQARGQIQSIAVSKYDAPFNGKEYFLLAGGRRYRAIKELGWPTINATVYNGDLNAHDIYAIELEENEIRKEMTWDEEVKLRAKKHKFWVELKGQSTPGADNEGHSLRDSAEMFNVSASTLSRDIRLAEVLEERPELATKFKNRAQATSYLKNLESKVEKAKQAKEIDSQVKSEDHEKLQAALASRYKVGDALELIKSIKPSTIDLINFDPDYPVETEQHLDGYQKLNADLADGDYHKLTKPQYEEFCKAMFQEIHRVLRPDGWLLVWFGYEYFQTLQTWLDEAGFEVNFRHGIWDKGGQSNKLPFRYLGYSFEPFFYVRKKNGTAKINKAHSNIFRFPAVHSSKKANPYEKPIHLMKMIFETFVPAGSKILDPTCGSGSSLFAGFNLRCKVTGFDLSTQQQQEFKVKCFEQVPLEYK